MNAAAEPAAGRGIDFDTARLEAYLNGLPGSARGELVVERTEGACRTPRTSCAAATGKPC
ncbi:MAG TPA: hypothetical protein VF308_14440 [Caldimonas sp.]